MGGLQVVGVVTGGGKKGGVSEAAGRKNLWTAKGVSGDKWEVLLELHGCANGLSKWRELL